MHEAYCVWSKKTCSRRNSKDEGRGRRGQLGKLLERLEYLESLRLCGFTVATAKDMRGVSRWGIGASTYFSNIKVLLRPTGEVLLPVTTCSSRARKGSKSPSSFIFPSSVGRTRSLRLTSSSREWIPAEERKDLGLRGAWSLPVSSTGIRIRLNIL